MCLSQTTGYAIMALAYVESLERKPCHVRDVAAGTGIPQPYLARIISRLSHIGILAAKRGYRGGIAVNRSASDISLLEVVEAVEGKDWIGPCLLGTQKCATHFVCPTHDFWVEIQRQIADKLRTTTLADVIAASGFSGGPKGGAARKDLRGAGRPRRTQLPPMPAVAPDVVGAQIDVRQTCSS